MPYGMFVIYLVLFLAPSLLAESDKRPLPWPPIVTSEKGIYHKSTYEVIQSSPYYSFSGIQYGRVLERFTEPAPVCQKPHSRKCRKGNRLISRLKPFNDLGRDYSSCPRAFPKWMTFHNERLQGNGSVTISGDEVEDCLFLDIFVPERVWHRTQNNPDLGYASTLIWIHDGGFTSGNKHLQGGPDTLLERTMEFHNAGAIIVSINYRLGLFGFLYGDKDIVSNVGLLDQRMALHWVQKHIQKFGGDPFRVTVIGEGAGAGAILHHITAPNMTRHLFRHYKKPSHHYQHFPFRSAIIHSPNFQPIIPSQSKLLMDKILGKASELSGRNINHPVMLRKLPFKVLSAVNSALVQESPYGTFTFGPVVDYRKSDKSYVPDFPLRRLKSGNMEKNVNVLVGYRKNEGRFLTPSSVGTDQGFQDHLAKIFPTTPKHDIKYISDHLYPISDYKGGEQSGMNRSADALQDLFMGCNIHYLLVFMERSYGYVLDTAWSNREQFLEKILFRGGAVPWGASSTNRFTKWLQGVFLQFGMFSTEGANEANLQPYHENRMVMQAIDDGFSSFVNNSAAKQQCRYWAYAPYEGIT